MKLVKQNRDLVGIVEAGCVIEGTISFNGNMRMNGTFKGDIKGDGQLFVGTSGKVDANIKVDDIVIEGKISGKVNATNKIEIHKGGELLADISTTTLVIEEGGIFRGTSMMNVAETIELNAAESHDDTGKTYKKVQG